MREKDFEGTANEYGIEIRGKSQQGEKRRIMREGKNARETEYRDRISKLRMARGRLGKLYNCEKTRE